jgi:hypothetical protein
MAHAVTAAATAPTSERHATAAVSSPRRDARKTKITITRASGAMSQLTGDTSGAETTTSRPGRSARNHGNANEPTAIAHNIAVNAAARRTLIGRGCVG